MAFVDFVTTCVNDGDAVDVVYTDFRKAFDTVPHRRLLNKCELSFWIKGKLLAWIGNYLKDRYQFVSVNGADSPKILVTSGVPQGGILSPVLFLMFIEDMDDPISGAVFKFADDAKIVRRLHREHVSLDIHDMIGDLVALKEWSEKWGMKFNVSKFRTMHFGFWNPEFQYRICGRYLESAEQHRDLGAIISSDLKASRHCEQAVKKANRIIGFISRCFVHMGKRMFLPIYYSLIRPILEYASCAWNPHHARNITLLERTQARATKLVKEIRHLEYEDRLRYLGLQKLETRRYRADLIMVYKMLNGLVQLDASAFFRVVQTRARGHSLKLEPVITPRLDCKRYCFAYRVINGWNSLRDEVVTAPTLELFKSRLHSYGHLPEL
jgi:hypothetical protein